MSDLDATFRCTHFACTLAFKHCLRRQSETRRKPGRTSAGKHFVRELSVHPHCAGGTCDQGNAIAAAHPQFTHQQHDPRKAPRLDIVRAVEESTMPRGRRAKPCPECGTTSTRCGSDCPTKGGKPARPAATTTPAPSSRPDPKARRHHPGGGPEDMTVQELLELRARLDQELTRRRAEAEAELRALDAALAAPSAVRSVG